jgi:hypothetical protein
MMQSTLNFPSKIKTKYFTIPVVNRQHTKHPSQNLIRQKEEPNT